MAKKSVSASPTKKFFVEMLTRDIELGDAILDLLDNCIDGILRSKKNSSKKKPYAGFFASITANKDLFEIKDNCGGIPESRVPYAFRIGREAGDVSEDIESIGVYGVGMKRAIFKMGRHCVITTRNSETSFSVPIDSNWMADDSDWELPVQDAEEDLKEAGTVIRVTKLLKSVQSEFDPEASSFIDDLKKKISGFFSFILEKGFEVTVNGEPIQAADFSLLFPDKIPKKEASLISPYVLEAKIGDVQVEAMIGFYRPLAKENEVDVENLRPRSREEAGISVACNDRVVLFKDKSRLVGWGTRGVPSFHNQFICISGIVFFKSRDTSKLPLTTTKHGLDTGSDVYLTVLELIAVALKKYTVFTNKWKGNEGETNDFFAATSPVAIHDLRESVPDEKLKVVPRMSAYGDVKEWKPDLPLPVSESTNKRIAFSRPISRIRTVSRFLYDTPDVSPSEIGAKCFDRVHAEAGRRK
ncbi:hypothetical protein ACVIHC_005889 [Bradyrhizobium diazoefficiens]